MGVGTGLLTGCLLLKKRAESRFWQALETGNGLTARQAKKSQCFKYFAQVDVLSARILESNTDRG